VSVTAPWEDRATAILWEEGTSGIEVRTKDRQIVLLSYFEARRGLGADLKSALRALPQARIRPLPVPFVDWLARFRKSFRPFLAGGFLIAPFWDPPTAPNLPVLLVDPGRAFGTGTHETTRLCLTALERAARGARVLDLGTGSGILAIAAALRGAHQVTAVDIDPDAIASGRRHAQLNQAEVHFVVSDGPRAFRANSFDLVVANLHARFLLERRAEIMRICRPEASLILSGLLKEDLPGLLDAYGGAAHVFIEGDWGALIVGEDMRAKAGT